MGDGPETPTGGAHVDGSGEVLATSGSGRLQAKLLAPVYGAMAVGWLVTSRTSDNRGLHLTFGTAFLLLAAGYLYLGYARPAARLVLTADTLELRRPFRSIVVRRTDVQGVRPSVAGHPSWSERVLLDTTAGVVTLPRFDSTVPRLIARLELWAGLGSDPVDPQP